MKIVYSVSQALESLLTWWNFSETTKLSDTNTKFEKIGHTLTTRPEKELKLRISPEKEHNKHPTRKKPTKRIWPEIEHNEVKIRKNTQFRITQEKEHTIGSRQKRNTHLILDQKMNTL